MGYSTQRKSKFYAKEVYGICKIPTNYAGSCPAPQTTEYTKNILPEMFYGFYNADNGGSGFDIGIRLDTGGSWVAFAYGTSGILAQADAKATFKSALSPGNTIYMKLWIQSGKVYLNVSKTGYEGTDLLNSPFQVGISNTTFANRANSGAAGYKINRELAIANGSAVANTYETSGCYMLNAEFLQHGYVTTSGQTYIWTDANSAVHLASSQEAFLPSNTATGRIIRIRKDYAQVNTNRIKVLSRTDGANGATEKVSIDFRSTPQI